MFFMWHEGMHYKAYVSKSDQDFCIARNYPKPFVEIDAHSVWKFSGMALLGHAIRNLNSTIFTVTHAMNV